MYKYNKPPGPSVGETFTVTCYTCQMPSSKEWAQLVQSRPYSPDPSVPFFPFLLQTGSPPPGALFSENGSTYLCAFCHALLESQWNAFEGKKEIVTPMQRKYFIRKFICAVCGVETYRKRVRALPFQEFPFLAKTRQPGSITLGNNPLAVVCLDCSETLWAQSAEYDRWGLPVHKRHFNWMARPPPPEDSVEATVARLPSGETQLPRCPPTEPLAPPKTNEPTALPEAIPPINKYVHRPRANSGLGLRLEGIINQQQTVKYSVTQPTSTMVGHRQGGVSPLALTRGPQTSPQRNHLVKTSHRFADSSNISTLEVNLHVQPPVVTVAPMSSLQHHHHHGIAGGRKNSLVYTISHMDDRSSPNNNKYELSTSSSSFGRPYGFSNEAALRHGGSQSSFPHHLLPYYSPGGHYPWPSSGTTTSSGGGGGGGGDDADVPDYTTPNNFDDHPLASSITSSHHHQHQRGHRHHHSTPWRQRESPTNQLYSPSSPYPSLSSAAVATVSNTSGGCSSSAVLTRGLAVDPDLPSPPSLIGHPLSLSTLFPQLRLQSAPCSSTTTTTTTTLRIESPGSSPLRIASAPSLSHQSRQNFPSPRDCGDYDMCQTLPNSTGLKNEAGTSLPVRHHPQLHWIELREANLSHNSSGEDEGGRIVRAHSTPTRTSLSPAEAARSQDYSLHLHHRRSSVQHRSSPFQEDDLHLNRDSSEGERSEILEERRQSRLSSQGISSGGGGEGRRDFLVPKKRYWKPSDSPISGENNLMDEENQLPKTRNTSELDSVLVKKRKFSINHEESSFRIYSDQSHGDANNGCDEVPSNSGGGEAGRNKHGAIDLSQKSQSNKSRMDSYCSSSEQNRLSPRSKFSIAYLSKSESLPEEKPKVSLEERTTMAEEENNQSCRRTNSSSVPPAAVAAGTMSPPSRQPITNTKDERENELAFISTSATHVSNDDKNLSSLILDDSFARKTIQYFMAKEAEARMVLNEIRAKQRNFLNQLGLITPKEKMGLELKSLSCRSERGTVPSPKLSELQSSPSEKSLTSILKTESDSKTSFLHVLGLRPKTEAKNKGSCSNSINTQSLRLSTNRAQIYQECSSSSCSSAHASQPSLPRHDDEDKDKEEEDESNNFLNNPVCIKYPKFVPGLDVKLGGNNPPCGDSDERRKCDHVLRIPVVHKRIVSLRNHNSNSEDDEVGENVTNSEYRDTCSATSTLLRDDNDNGMNELDAILLTAKLHWRKSRKLLLRAINETKLSYCPLEEQLDRVQTIRRHLTMQHSEIRDTDMALETLEKHIFNNIESVSSRNRQSLPKV
ncbi:uncharacterized protein LOC110855928 isoform X2 [Folsomia candida]|uniref:Uncharacterized protein n=1 Tax=Folsomia candida TaxID=158441 RepID=A0A226DQH4_FOLCA|nr:uncharacterized protein LOC110855928 isoform X2 [Folsomia candida]OXA46931.1 hypothetical protein Fcan01_18530 [Folsomia candida]